MNGASPLPPTIGSLKDPLPILEQRLELLEGENRMLHGKLQSAYRRLAEIEGRDAQQALEELLLELEKTEKERQRRLGEERAFEGSKKDSPALETLDSNSDSSSSDSSSSKPRQGHGPRPQTRLDVSEVTYELADEDRQCPVCNGELVAMGEQFEEYEEITVLERKYTLRKVKRRKYRCRCNACVVTAPAPPRLIPGGRYSLDLAVQVAVDKYLDHLPLERQVRIMNRLGLEVTSQTLWDQIEALARILVAIYQALGLKVSLADVVHADETRWPRLDSARASPWMVWTRCTPEIAHYSILSSKSARAARRLFSGYSGVLVVDGYQVYEKLSRESSKVHLANCWAHVRRKFEESRENFPKPCGWILARIGELYAIERQVPGPFPGDESAQEQRLQLREEKSRPIVRSIYDWACTEVGLPQSALGKNIRYMLRRWKALTLFLEHPRVPLDNNAAERSLRGPVVGRKVHYGSKSKRGTEVAALFYTLLETAKLQGVDPAGYLKAAAQRALKSPGAVLLPEHYAAAQA